MKQFTRRQMKKLNHFFKEKDERAKINSSRFLHRAPSGDARKREPIIRLIAGKVDNIVIVSSFRLPPVKSGLIDRFLVISELENVHPIIVFNKIDLLEDRKELNQYLTLYRSIGYTALGISAETGEGVEVLQLLLEGRTSALAGHSGVGKSTLLNRLYPDLPNKPETSEVSISNKKGRHTTTSVSLYRVNGTTIFDMPGLKYASIHGLEQVDLQSTFPEFTGPSRHCRFDDCIHESEPGCRVKEAVEEGIIDRERYDSYIRILGSL